MKKETKLKIFTISLVIITITLILYLGVVLFYHPNVWVEKEVEGTFNKAYGTVEGIPDAIAMDIDNESYVFIESRGWGLFIVQHWDELPNSRVLIIYDENLNGDKKLNHMSIKE